MRPAAVVNATRVEFRQHGDYTRRVLDGVVDNGPSTAVDVERLLRNQDDIGALVQPIVGTSKADKLAALLRQHIGLASVVITKYVGGARGDELASHVSNLFENSDLVGDHLASLVPSKLNSATMKLLFKQHNQFVIDMTVARDAGDYVKENALYDRYMVHLLGIGDTLAVAMVS